ncbi:hypothetical protein BC826DRAFT_1109914 [Russula brevipes]|nr:hypothetical protein BC826DRAFT_1109914 [Russula brevipes]
MDIIIVAVATTFMWWLLTRSDLIPDHLMLEVQWVDNRNRRIGVLRLDISPSWGRR